MTFVSRILPYIRTQPSKETEQFRSTEQYFPPPPAHEQSSPPLHSPRSFTSSISPPVPQQAAVANAAEEDVQDAAEEAVLHAAAEGALHDETQGGGWRCRGTSIDAD